MTTTMTMTELERLVARHEGFRSHLYRCSAGKLTIGYGTNIEEGISKAEGLLLLRHRLGLAVADLERRLPYWSKLTPARQQVLASMQYQLRSPGVFGFRKMLEALSRSAYDTAAREMLDSKWARRDSPGRAKELAEMMRRG